MNKFFKGTCVFKFRLLKVFSKRLLANDNMYPKRYISTLKILFTLKIIYSKRLNIYLSFQFLRLLVIFRKLLLILTPQKI